MPDSTLRFITASFIIVELKYDKVQGDNILSAKESSVWRLT